MKKLSQIISDLKPKKDDAAKEQKDRLRRELRDSEAKGEAETRPSPGPDVEHR